MDNNGTIWVKNGADKRKVIAKEEIARLLQSAGNLFADEITVNASSIDDIDETLFQQFIRAKTGEPMASYGQSLSSVLANLKIFKDGKPGLSGLLLLGKNPQQFRPTFTVQCVAMR